MTDIDDHKKRTPRHWTTLDEYRGEGDVARLKSEEFIEKPERLFDALDVARASHGNRPGAAVEAAGFLEEAVSGGASHDGLSRRDFLKLSAAAMAFATAGCALRPVEKIVPYVKAPEDLVPGVANYYASTMGDAAGVGVLVKTREGRPIKIEGNPQHPLSQGRLTAAGQAAIFGLYDPDRLRGPVRIVPRGARRGAEPIAWPDADSEIAKALTDARGRVALLTGTLHGPARTRLISDFLQAFPGGRHVMCDAWTHEATRSAQEKCYGTAVTPRYRFDRADYFLFFDCDPLGSGLSSLEWQVDFGKTRKLRDGDISKAVAFEPCMTLTGSNCDERYRVRSDDVLRIALAVAHELSVVMGHVPGKTDPTLFKAALSRYRADGIESDAGLPEGTISRVARELWVHREHGLVMAGESEPLQIVANLLNTICGNDGRAVDGTMSPSRQSRASFRDLDALIADMKAGRVDALIVWGANPVYWLPPSTRFEEALGKVKLVVALADRVDETAQHAHFVLPTLHWLESWGDAEPQAGLFSLIQPAIRPLHDARAAEESLMAFARTAKAGSLSSLEGGWHEYIVDAWRTQVYLPGSYEAPFELFWTSALREGVVNTVIETGGEAREFCAEALSSIRVADGPHDVLELCVVPSPILGDGRDANNAWLLECPDPVSRITWTNFASISPATAEKLGLREGDVVKLESGDVSIEIPVHVQPGDMDGVISVQAGWGRTRAGQVGSGVGVNAFALRRIENGRVASRGLPCSITPTGRREKLPCVQGHQYIEGRPIIAEATLAEHRLDPQAGHFRAHDAQSAWPPHEYTGNRWGMTVDLTSCTGCNACIIACQVENNIPVVGREQVTRGRELHWIRIDRYYSGSPDDPEVTYQPMLCQHCENASCETVCPVLATVHNEEGLNQQIYNRCVGTRYCSNNCPYKVRRFNWHEFAFSAYDEPPLKLGLNPEVTVREKGVMEKCTFCVQRIRHGKEHAKDMSRAVEDGDIVTACEQTCPTGAITFGNINDPRSRVSEAMKDGRSYRVLDQLAVKPSISYWTKLRNRPAKDTNSGEEHHS